MEIGAPLQRTDVARSSTSASIDDIAAQATPMDGDSRITRGEFASFIPDRVRRADRNGDGQLSLRELMYP